MGKKMVDFSTSLGYLVYNERLRDYSTPMKWSVKLNLAEKIAAQRQYAAWQERQRQIRKNWHALEDSAQFPQVMLAEHFQKSWSVSKRYGYEVHTFHGYDETQ